MKDVFGLKVVVGDAANARRLQEALEGLRFGPEELEEAGIELNAGHDQLKFLEVKDYLTAMEQAKRLGSSEECRSGGMAFRNSNQPCPTIFANEKCLPEKVTRRSKPTASTFAIIGAAHSVDGFLSRPLFGSGSHAASAL